MWELTSCWLYDVSIYLMQVLSSRTHVRSVFLSEFKAIIKRY